MKRPATRMAGRFDCNLATGSNVRNTRHMNLLCRNGTTSLRLRSCLCFRLPKTARSLELHVSHRIQDR